MRTIKRGLNIQIHSFILSTLVKRPRTQCLRGLQHMDGRFSDNGRPLIDIEVTGVDKTKKTSFTALVDTGYTGFLNIPFALAAPLGLTLIGTESYNLADGSETVYLTCLGTIHVDGKMREGTVDVKFGGGSILVGMEFIRQFSLSFFTDPLNQIVRVENAPTPQFDTTRLPVVESSFEEAAEKSATS